MQYYNSTHFLFLSTLFLILITPILSFDVPPELSSICPNGCKRYYHCSAKEQKCVFKGFLPLYPLELLELLCMCISSALATACGIGGGTVYSALLLGIEGFEPLEAFPISNVLIFSCGIVTFIACVMDKYKNPKNKFVQYDVALIFGPSMLVGTKFGTILNKTFSSLFLTIAVLIVLSYSIKNTYKNVQKAKAREAKMFSDKVKGVNELLYGGSNNANSSEQDEYNEVRDKIEMIELTKDATIDGSEKNMFNTQTPTTLLTPEDQEILNEDANPLRWDRIKFMLILELVILVDQLIEGNAKLPSFIGIRRCSFGYWFVFILYIVVSGYLLKVAITEVQIHFNKRKSLDPNYKVEVMENILKNIYLIIAVAVLAGIISSMVGIGGGIITNPMFASLGLDPKESSSTSNFLIITTAIASTICFAFAGQLKYSYAICVGIPCVTSAFIGSFIILRYINKTGRSSILLEIMYYFLIASMVIIVYKALIGLGSQSISSVFELNSFC